MAAMGSAASALSKPSPPPSSAPKAAATTTLGPDAFVAVTSLSPDDVKVVYDELMIPGFPVRDELDPLEAWLEGHPEDADRWKREPHGRRFFALKPPASLAKPDGSGPRFAALCVVETFAADPARGRAPTALLAYIVTHPSFRRLGLAKRLVDLARKDHPVLFLETETIPAEPGEERDVRLTRMSIHKHNGFAVVDKFHYVQPPCSEDQGPCDDLTLMVYRESPSHKTVPGEAVFSFVHAMCDAYGALDTDYGKEMATASKAAKAFALV